MTREEADRFLAWFRAAEESALPTDDGQEPSAAAVQSVEIVRPVAEVVRVMFDRRPGEELALDFERDGTLGRIHVTRVDPKQLVKLVQ